MNPLLLHVHVHYTHPLSQYTYFYTCMHTYTPISFTCTCTLYTPIIAYTCTCTYTCLLLHLDAHIYTH